MNTGSDWEGREVPAGRSGSNRGQEPPLPPVPPPHDDQPVPPGPVLQSDRIALAAGFSRERDRFAVEYTVENRGSREIWVLDVRETTPPEIVAPALPRVLFEAPETVVVACWDSFRQPPPGTMWATPPAFYGTLVAVGEQYRSVMHLPLPLTLSDARGIRAGRTVTCRYARFEVAIIPGRPGITPINAGGRQRGRFFLSAMASRLLLASAPVPVDVLLVREGP